MKLAIHKSKTGFHPRWVTYCERNGIPFKIVDCYANDVISQLTDCEAFFWHHSHSRSKDILFARQLLFSLEQTGMLVFPNFNTAWYFDDKVGQKYLLEAIQAPMVNSYVFYDKKEALDWINQTSFPKVFKLRGGAGSANVKLVRSTIEAKRLVKKAFGKGFRQYEPWTNLQERWRNYKKGKTNLYDILKGVLRLYKEPEFSKTIGRERGYIYFQEFVPNNDFDIRIIVIGKKAFALKRMVREDDFRASGSGNMKFEREEFDERCIKIAFKTNKKLKAQCLAYDFVFDDQKKPLIVEISFGFDVEAYDQCPGYWDEKLKWHEGKFIPQEWMVEDLIYSLKHNK